MIMPNLLLESILNKSEHSLSDLEFLLSTKDLSDQTRIKDHAYAIKTALLGKVVHYRGLIELSNHCEKDCLYCGIRKSNQQIKRYDVTQEEAVKAARFAYTSGYGSIVIQTGERKAPKFTSWIENLLKEIHQATEGKLGITLSCGEQSGETYLRWKDAGASRYLLRMETTNPFLYQKIHPRDDMHSFDNRLQCLQDLKALGYQVGSGIMIGLPGQSVTDLAKDLLFFKEAGVHMVGMGPYIEHSATPLYQTKDQLLSQEERYRLSQLMISVLRILMKDINIAAATALQAIRYNGREDAILSGANIIMPNITPLSYRSHYLLYENKPCTDEQPEMCKNCLEGRLHNIGEKIGYHQRGDSMRYHLGKSTV